MAAMVSLEAVQSNLGEIRFFGIEIKLWLQGGEAGQEGCDVKLAELSPALKASDKVRKPEFK